MISQGGDTSNRLLCVDQSDWGWSGHHRHGQEAMETYLVTTNGLCLVCGFC